MMFYRIGEGTYSNGIYTIQLLDGGIVKIDRERVSVDAGSVGVWGAGEEVYNGPICRLRENMGMLRHTAIAAPHVM